MDDLNKIELIEKFLAGSLTKEEQVLFDSLIESDNSFKKEVALQKDIQEEIAGEAFHSFRKTLDSANSKVIVKKPKARLRTLNTKVLRNVIGLAASILLIFFVYKSFNDSTSFNGNDVYASNLESYPMLLSQRTIDTTSFSIILQKAIESYQLKDYAKSAIYFNQLAVQQPEIAAYQFYAGLSNLLAGKLDSAEPILVSLEENDDHLFMEQSRWFLALILIKKEQNQEAVQILKKINIDHFNYKQAQKLLQQLE